MITGTQSSTFPSERHDRRVDAPFITVDVPHELARLRAERAYQAEGHAGRTLTKYPDLRIVLEAMRPRTRQRLHETAERMTLHVILGRLRVWTEDGASCDLAEGSFTAIEAERVHELECLEECAFLLTLGWPPAAGRTGASGERQAHGGGI